MASFLRIRNLDKYQHYRNRNPPWVKLHRDLLEDYDFEQLPDATKGHALLLLLLASRLGNEIPNDADWIARKIGAKSKVDIAKLLESKFLETYGATCEQDASKLLAPSKQVALAEGERETEKRERQSKASGEFDLLWAACKRKAGPDDALKSYLKLRKSGEIPPVEEVIRSLNAMQASDDWTKEGRKYQPHLSTWLNRGGWKEEPRQSNGSASGTASSFDIHPDTVKALARRREEAIERSRAAMQEPDSTVHR